MRGFDRGLADFFNIDGVAQSGIAVPIVNLENLGHALADAHQEDPFRPGEGEHGRAALQLVSNVFAAI